MKGPGLGSPRKACTIRLRGVITDSSWSLRPLICSTKALDPKLAEGPCSAWWIGGLWLAIPVDVDYLASLS